MLRFRPRLEALDDRIVPSQVSLTVSSLADAGTGSLRAAIMAADSGSHSDKFTIDFAVTGSIDLQSPLPNLNNSIAIQGPGASSLTVEPAAGYSFASAIVTVDFGQTAGLSGLTVANGDAGGIFNNGGALTVANCAIVNNSAASGGGIVNEGALTVNGCTLSGDSADLGGGIANFSGTATVANSLFCGNSARAGGGIYNIATLSVSGSGLSGNSASSTGGGIYNNGELTAVNITVQNNSAAFGGGIFNGGDLTLRNSTLANNSAGFGGGVDNFGAFTVQGSNFTGNSATRRPFGAGVLPGFGSAICNAGAATATGCTFSGNRADDLGGAIFNFAVPSGTFEVRDSVFAGNSADAGGAFYNDGFAFSGGTASATLAVRDCSFLANTATDSGGAIYNGGTATIQQSTLSGNSAGSDGGGIFNAASGALSVKDSRVLGNFALLGADLFNDHGGVTVNDSVIGD